MVSMSLFSRIKQDKRGATLVEFAIVAPVLLTIIMGIMDVAYNQYARGVLEGEVQRAARKLTMESAADLTNQTAMDTSVRTQFLKVVSPATVTFKRTWYTNYEIATKRKEDFSDTNGNSTCDNGEAFEDFEPKQRLGRGCFSRWQWRREGCSALHCHSDVQAGLSNGDARRRGTQCDACCCNCSQEPALW